MIARTRNLTAALMLTAGLAAFAQPITSAAPGDPPAPRLDTHGDPLPVGARARLGTLRWRHGAGVLFVSYSEDGKQLLTASQDGTLRLWDVENGRELRRIGKEVLPPHISGVTDGNAWMVYQRSQITAAAMSPDAKTIAAVVQEGTLTLWEAESGKELRKWKTTPNGSFGIAFTPDNKQLITMSHDQFVRVWDVADGKEVRKMGGPNAALRRYLRGGPGSPIGFAADGTIVLAPANEQKNNRYIGIIRRWELATGKDLPSIEGPANGFQSVAYSRDGKHFWWAGNDGSLVQWDMDAGKEVRRINGVGANSQATSMALSADGKVLATRAHDASVRLWDVAQGKELRKVGAQQNPQQFMYYGQVACNIAFAPDARFVCTGAGPNSVGQWDIATGQSRGPATAFAGPISALAVSADGKTVVTRSTNNMAHVWDTTNPKESRSLTLVNNGANLAVISNDGLTLLLSGGYDNTVRVYDVKAGKEVRNWRVTPTQAAFGGVSQLIGLALSPDGKVVATRGSDQIIRLHDAQTGKESKQIPETGEAGGNGNRMWNGGHNPQAPTRIGFSPDGNTLATLPVEGGYFDPFTGQQFPADPTIRLWDVATGRAIRRLDTPRSAPTCFAFTRDGRTLATGNQDGTISFWESVSGKERFHFKTGQAGQARSLAYSPDGKALIAAGQGHTIGVWDAITGKELKQLEGHQSMVVALAFAGDGKTFVSGSMDATALVWDAADTVKPPAQELTKLTPQQLDAMWTDLADADARKAFDALGTLARTPEQSVALFRERVKAVPPLDVKLVAKLLEDIESEKFVIRNKATRDLESLGILAEPALKKALAAGPTLDGRQRLERLLEKVAVGQTPPPEELRAMRALEVLERLGTAEARTILEAVTKGADGAHLTRQAQASLQRLGK